MKKTTTVIKDFVSELEADQPDCQPVPIKVRRTQVMPGGYNSLRITIGDQTVFLDTDMFGAKFYLAIGDIEDLIANASICMDGDATHE